MHLEKKSNRALVSLGVVAVLCFLFLGIITVSSKNPVNGTISIPTTSKSPIPTPTLSSIPSSSPSPSPPVSPSPMPTPSPSVSAIQSPSPDDTNSAYENENPDGNFVNEEYGALKGDWLYYCNVGDGWKIYRVRTDGSNNQKISDEKSKNIKVAEEWVYYCNEDDSSRLYKIRMDGTARQMLPAEITNNFCIADGWVYYINDSKLYRIPTSGNDRQQIADPCTGIIDIVGEWIYYINNRTTSRTSSDDIYRISTDGKSKQRIIDGGVMRYFTRVEVVDDWIYCIDKNSRGADSRNFYRVRTDGTGKTIISRDKENSQIVVDYFHVIGEWIYYKLRHYVRDERSYSDYKQYRVRTDGTGEEAIANEDITILYVADEWVYYNNKDEGNIFCKMRIDGTDKQMIATDYVIVVFHNVGDDWIYYLNRDDNNNLYKIQNDGTNRQLVE